MDFFDVVLKRRSVRRFKRDKVSQRALNRILEAGRWAPSGANLQPWRFIVVASAEVKAKIADVCSEFSRRVWKNFPLKLPDSWLRGVEHGTSCI